MRSSSLLIPFFVLVACGGRMTSVDGNQNTSSLNPTDQNQLCLDTYNYVRSSFSNDDIAKMECGLSGASSTQASPTCATTYQTCVTNAEQQLQTSSPFPATPDCTGFDASIAACNTTVAEYTKCLQEEVNAFKSLESTFPLCSQAQATSAELAAMNQISTDCIQLMQTCKLTFAPSGSSGGGSVDAGGGG